MYESRRYVWIRSKIKYKMAVADTSAKTQFFVRIYASDYWYYVGYRRLVKKAEDAEFTHSLV